MRRASLLPLCFAIAFAAGCFNPPDPPCAFLCGGPPENMTMCPDGYSCRPDGWCKRDGSGSDNVADNFVCDDTIPPAIDAASVDAGIDAAIADGGPDAGDIDAAIPDAGDIDAALGALGDSCSGGGECQSGNCSNSVCCDTACGGDCDVCTAALGASADGTCTLLSGTTCRAAAGECDVAETCDGASATCPVDDFVGAGIACTDPTPGDCDDAQCDGAGACNATQGIEGSSYVCRPAAGECDLAELCDGTTGGACDTDLFVTATTPCEEGVAEPTCDPHECDGAGLCEDLAEPADTTACTEGGGDTCCSLTCITGPGGPGTCS
jgi:hypothetical protein